MPETSLSEQDLLKLSRISSISPAAARRVLGTINIVFKIKLRATAQVEDQLKMPSEQIFNIGLNLMALVCSQSQRQLHLEPLGELICEYQRNCPIILNWIARGDFNPTKVPENISVATLRHASRTAGRLRAEFIRGRALKI